MIRPGAFTASDDWRHHVAGEQSGSRPTSAARSSPGDAHSDLAAQVATAARRNRARVAAAESLTGGLIASKLARAPAATEWFRGGVVAYVAEVKQSVLGVRPGPVVTERTVRDMAAGVIDLLDATIGIAVSGAAGPGRLEGNAPGTVWLAARYDDGVATQLRHLAGSPDEVCSQTCTIALELLLGVLADRGAL